MSLHRLLLPTVMLGLLAVPASAWAATTTSDLAVSTAAPATVPEEQNFTFTITATNNGPDDAQNVEADFTVPTNSSFVSFVNITQGSASETVATGVVTASFGTITNGNSASLTISLAAPHRGTIAATPSVTFNPAGSQVDPNSANNSVTTPIAVTGITATTPSAFADQPLGTLSPAQTVTVTNNSSQSITFGALPASGANGSDFLAAGNACAGATLAAGASCTLALRFAPGDLGARTALIDFAPTSGPVDPLELDLTGNGIPLPVNTGPPGPQGAQGPQGPPAFKLVLAGAVQRLVARHGRPVTLAYASTLSAHVVLDVLKGHVRVARITGHSRRGANRIRWNGKRHGTAVSPGHYILRLTAKNGDQTTTLKVPLTLY